MATVKHEIFHALGFAPSLYAFFRNQSGEPLTARRSNGLPKEYDDVLKHYKWSEQVRLLTHYIEDLGIMFIYLTYNVVYGLNPGVM